MTSVEELAVQILHDASDSLEQRGWHQGSLIEGTNSLAGFFDPTISSDSARCIMGHITLAEALLLEDETTYWIGAQNLVRSALELAINEDVSPNTAPNSVWGDWNDAPERTIEDIREAFRYAEKHIVNGKVEING